MPLSSASDIEFRYRGSGNAENLAALNSNLTLPLPVKRSGQLPTRTLTELRRTDYDTAPCRVLY
jgi:hypothetical protein